MELNASHMAPSIKEYHPLEDYIESTDQIQGRCYYKFVDLFSILSNETTIMEKHTISDFKK